MVRRMTCAQAMEALYIMNQKFLVRVGAAWFEVSGEVRPGGVLWWTDTRDGQQGLALPGEWMEAYPRPWSRRERRTYRKYRAHRGGAQ